MIIRLVWALAALSLLVFVIYESATYGWVMGITVIVFAVLPDLALIGAFDPIRRGRLRPQRVTLYNAMHRPWFALTLVGIGSVLVLPAVGGVDDSGKVVAAAGLAWLLHIATDRASGYGLRAADGSIRPVGRTPARTMCEA